MKTDRIILYKIKSSLKEAFLTKFGIVKDLERVLVEIQSDGISGWGEAACLPFPFYNHEDSHTVFYILEKYLCPIVIAQQPQDILSLNALLDRIIGNNGAKSGIEAAFWDLMAQKKAQPLYKFLGGIRSEVEAGVAIPECDDVNESIELVSKYVGRGYNKIKLKFSPHSNLNVLAEIRNKFPNLKVAIDANGSYSLEHLALIKSLDQFKLLMLEQPLKAGDLLEHAELQTQIDTAICLDESICTYSDAQTAIALKSCKIINLKPARVGGHLEAKRIHDLAQNAGIAVCIGGMFESGIGRAHNLALATLSNFIYPGDLSESDRYSDEDIIEPKISFYKPGVFKLSEQPGIGVRVLKDKIESLALTTKTFSPD